jgi:hypothetical protein
MLLQQKQRHLVVVGESSQMAGLAALVGVQMGSPSKEVDLLDHN